MSGESKHRPSPERLDLAFKGSRAYLQGGDICQAIMELAEQHFDRGFDRMQLAIHRFMSHQPDLHWFEGEAARERPADAAADLSVVSGDLRIAGWLTESSRPVTRRVDFDETRIESLCVLQEESVSLSGDPGFLPIEIAVSMTKYLHNRCIAPGAGRWIFTKIDLLRALRADEGPRLTVSLQHNLHNRLTRSMIDVAGRPVGNIYFSLLKP